MEINAVSLGNINNGVSVAYNTAFWEAATVYGDYTYSAPSSGPEEIYPRLDLIAGLREWVGERVIESLSLSTFTIRNRTFEKTIAIDREAIEDDKYGLLTPAAQQLGQNAAHLPDLLTTGLLLAGHTAPTYDGQTLRRRASHLQHQWQPDDGGELSDSQRQRQQRQPLVPDGYDENPDAADLPDASAVPEHADGRAR